MALTIEASTDERISLEEMVDFCDSHPQLVDPEFTIAHADRLRALANDRRSLVDFLNRELADLGSFQDGNEFKPVTFILHRGEHYTIRAVVWLPLEDDTDPAQFSYFDAHDHFFDFLTCGLYGPGYRTVLYEYDREGVVGYVGEPVEIRKVEETMLPTGKLMFYRASRDIHVQYPPDELSMSLNLILHQPDEDRIGYFFDLERGVISGHINDLPLRRTLFAVARKLGDGTTDDILETLGREHACPRTRAFAWETLLQRHPDDAETLARRASRDPSPYVESVARRTADALSDAPASSAT